MDLSDSGFDTELSRQLRSLSDVEKRTQDLQHGQSEDDVNTFMSTGVHCASSPAYRD